MKYGVNRQILLITAGAVWIIAGANILRIGIVTWLNTSQDWMFKIGEATVVLLFLFLFVFGRKFYKNNVGCYYFYDVSISGKFERIVFIL